MLLQSLVIEATLFKRSELLPFGIRPIAQHSTRETTITMPSTGSSVFPTNMKRSDPSGKPCTPRVLNNAARPRCSTSARTRKLSHNTPDPRPKHSDHCHGRRSRRPKKPTRAHEHTRQGQKESNSERGGQRHTPARGIKRKETPTSINSTPTRSISFASLAPPLTQA